MQKLERHIEDALEAAAGILEGKHAVKVTVMSFDLADPHSPQRLFDAVTSEGWYYARDGRQAGPVGEHALRQLILRLDSR